ncbi:MAG: hypothetical protein KJ667_02900, partial [Alphaproteobacteria bacterium]|nr:hypothetical protein [Alphaproteobacteria bacterium]
MRMRQIIGRIATGAVLMCGLGLSMPTSAQTVPPPAVTGTADPARINRSVIPDSREWQTLEQAAPQQQVIPMVPDGAEDIRFVLRSLSIDGMTAYDVSEVRRLYADYLGQEISVATLFAIMGQLQEKYLQDGYTLTRVYIPNQNIEDGNARLTVVEGYVAHVELSPDIRRAAVIDDAQARILAMRPLNTIVLERLLLVLNDLPGLNVSAIIGTIKAGDPVDATPGAVRILLQKNHRHIPFARVTFDNAGSKFSGPYQINANAMIPHVGISYSALDLTTIAATSLQEQRYGAWRYAIPLFGASGAKLSWGGTMARTEPGGSLDILDVKGRSESASVRVSYPVIKQRART